MVATTGTRSLALDALVGSIRSIVALVWLPGQATPIHDHVSCRAGVACLGVVEQLGAGVVRARCACVIVVTMVAAARKYGWNTPSSLA
jgi:hypothetical protein